MDMRRRLDRERNPFFKHAEAEYLIAWRDGQPVGRISAHIDHRFNDFQDNRWGLFGFFECEDSPETAHALLRAAESWLRARGRDLMVGPMDFTTNDEVGLMIEGFERRPIILSSWHHPYYRALIESYGFEKAVDWLMWSLHISGRSRVRDAIWSRPSTGSSAGRCENATWMPRSRASSRYTTPPGSATGRRCR
jgi:hypothetical protein